MQAIEWNRCVELAGGDEKLAKTLLALFMQHLPASQLAIQEALLVENYSELARQLHKLYGACCYCAVPMLTDCLMKMEEAIKADKLALLLELNKKLNEEVKAVAICYEKFLQEE